MLVRGFHYMEQGDLEEGTGQLIDFRSDITGMIRLDTYQPCGFQLPQKFAKRLTTTF